MKHRIDDAAFERIADYLNHERCLCRMSEASLRRFIEIIFNKILFCFCAHCRNILFCSEK